MAPPVDRQGVDDHVIKVMVVGDSISHGREGDWTWRYRIWEWFCQQGIRVLFVGPYKGTVPPDEPEPPRPPPLASEPSQHPPPLRTGGGYAADVAHEFLEHSNHFSASGRQAYHAQWLIGEQVAAYEPHICFVQLGFNDLAWRKTGPKDTLESIKHLIDEARSVKPDLKFAVANVPHRTDLPGRPDLPVNTDIYNALLARSIPSWNSPESPIALVRLCENYSCGGTTSEAAYDGLHPNALGEYQLAQAFSRVLVSSLHLGRAELVIPEQIPPRPIPTPANFLAVAAPSGIVVTWDPVYGAYGYDIRARLAGSADWPPGCYVACNRYDTRYCVAGQVWEYQVRACAGDGVRSRWSGVASAVARPETAPGPRNIVTHATPTGFTIAWEPPPPPSPPSRGEFAGEVDRYGVLVLDTDTPGSFPRAEGVRGERAELSGLTPGHRYNVAVETWTGVGGGLPAGARSVAVGRGTPPAPPWVRAVVVNDTAVELRWVGDPSAAGYGVWIRNVCAVGCEARRLCDVSPDPEPSDPRLRKCLLSNLLPSVWDFRFAVSAYNGNDDSGLSEWVVAPFLAHEEPSVGERDSIRITVRYA
ncbi:Factor for adipocyte differentiation [Madurella fahalii]|uniref:Factor for adipocyte differentiation n=1 Tax=Madurella fahalii TaxID=1157608 RepID=A0ABQ0GK33_9PEZI